MVCCFGGDVLAFSRWRVECARHDLGRWGSGRQTIRKGAQLVAGSRANVGGIPSVSESAALKSDPTGQRSGAAAHMWACWCVCARRRSPCRSRWVDRPRASAVLRPAFDGRSLSGGAGSHPVEWLSDLSWRRSFLIQHRVDGRGHSARTTPPLASTDRRIRSAQRRCAVGLVCRRHLRRWSLHRRRRQRREDRAEVESGTDTFSD